MVEKKLMIAKERIIAYMNTYATEANISNNMMIEFAPYPTATPYGGVCNSMHVAKWLQIEATTKNESVHQHPPTQK